MPGDKHHHQQSYMWDCYTFPTLSQTLGIQGIWGMGIRAQLNKYFSDLHVYSQHLGSSSKCRVGFSRSGACDSTFLTKSRMTGHGPYCSHLGLCWGSSVGKESSCNAGDPGLIPGSGRSPGEGVGYPLQYSWASLVAQLVKNLLQCQRPRFDSWIRKIPWRREWLPTPVFWPGEFHGLYSPWGRKELDMTERLSLSLSFTEGPSCAL